MGLRLYSTLTRTIEPFRPLGDEVKMYVCGVTPYDTTHLGHAFCYVVFDVLGRYLRYLGHRVRYLQNITDIDNDILRRAKELGERWDELGNRYAALHQRSLDRLGVVPPEKYPRATEEIPMMLDIIQTLIQRGHAYEVKGNVYFRVASDPGFGRLSGLGRAEMAEKLSETGDPADDPLKEAPVDFLLWMAAKPGEPTWESPWGPGRPGWHIECSAMSMRYFGDQLDIHGGGGDLVYPHHECEIAQSQAWSRKEPFSRVWMHVGMLKMDGEKMSKSLGNMEFVHRLLDNGHTPEAIRLYLLGCHYRGILEYRLEDLVTTQATVAGLQRAARLDEPAGAGAPVDASALKTRFLAAMDDDLDTPGAIAALVALADEVTAGHAAGRSIAAARQQVRELGGILGLELAGE